jgi:hypothetical protein
MQGAEQSREAMAERGAQAIAFVIEDFFQGVSHDVPPTSS